MKREKNIKPSGLTGPIKAASDFNNRVTAEFIPIEFPKTKDEIEKFIIKSFISASQKKNYYVSTVINIKQNNIDDFDFTLIFPKEEKYMELMEIAPLENLKGSYEKAPSSYKPFDFAKYIFDKIKKKSIRYKNSSKKGIYLLLYITDWHFALSETLVELLQYWSITISHSFEAIYLYVPISMDEGIPTLIFPTFKELWKDFNDQRYKENVVYNLDPMKW